MEDKKEKSSGSFETFSGSKGKSQDDNWNVLAVRSKVTDRCLWSACKAMTAGFVLILVGAGMATLGFYSDHLSKVEETKGNTTVWVKNDSKDSHFGILTYLGPVVMGIGGFTVVAACVMTFEARDTAAKIVPIWFKRTRIHVVSGGSGSTPSGRSSKASWERFLSYQRSTEDAGDNRTAVTESLVNFSKFLQKSVDTNKINRKNLSIINQQMSIRKCPSEPNLAKALRDANGNNLPEKITVFETSTPQPSQRTHYGGGVKTTPGTTKPQLLSVAPDTYRQAVSMDCPRSTRYDEDNQEAGIDVPVSKSLLQQSNKNRIQTMPFQSSCATSSSGSMSVDIYLPQGAVTVKVHDDMKETKQFSVKDCVFNANQSTTINQKSDIPSFEIDDDLVVDLDDSVFISQEFCVPKSEIASDSTILCLQPPFVCTNNISFSKEKDQSSAEIWTDTYHNTFSLSENKSESLEVQTPEESPMTSSLRSNFSFECSETISRGYSIDSCISNPLSGACARPSLSKTDTSFYNLSSLNSMGSSQDINSPSIFCGSNRCFDYDQKPASVPQTLSVSHLASVQALRGIEIPKKTINFLSESSRNLDSTKLDPGLSDEKHRNNLRKHNSLESAQIQSSKKSPPKSKSPKRQPLSLEGGSSKLTSDSSLISPLSPRFLSPNPLSPTSLAFSPRKTRSESLPERRQAPSLKRFPLLRQGALDSMIEEKGSQHRLDRSQTQIYSKDP